LLNNQDVQVAGFEPLRAEADLVEARAIYDPTIVASNTFGREKRPIASTLDTGSIRDESLTQDTWSFAGGLQQRVPTGGRFSITQQMSYTDTNSQLTVPNPQYMSSLAFELSQPLLKDAGDPDGEAAIRVATLATGISLHDFRRQVMETVSRVTSTYWQLAFDQRMIEVSEESLVLAREVLRRETVRAERGVSNELNIARAASAAASRAVQVVRARNRAADDADSLKRLLSAPEMPVEGEAEVIPIQQPRFFVVEVDRSAAMAHALTQRPELVRARRLIDMQRIRVEAADRQRLPRLDALLRYTLNGLGNDLGASMGTQDFRDPVTWVAGLELEWPIGNRTAQAELRRRRIDYEQTLLQADRLTEEVLQEVSLAVRSVRQGRDEIESTLQALDAARTVLEGEHTRLELQPMDRRSNDELLRAQTELAQTRQDHLMALLNFNLALTELSRAQGTLLADQNIEVIWPEGDGLRPLDPVRVRVPEKPEPGPDDVADPAGDPVAGPAAPNAPARLRAVPTEPEAN